MLAGFRHAGTKDWHQPRETYMSTSPKLQAQAERTFTLLQRLADGLERLNDEKLEPAVMLVEAAVAAKAKATGASASTN